MVSYLVWQVYYPLEFIWFDIIWHSTVELYVHKFKFIVSVNLCEHWLHIYEISGLHLKLAGQAENLNFVSSYNRDSPFDFHHNTDATVKTHL